VTRTPATYTCLRGAAAAALALAVLAVAGCGGASGSVGRAETVERSTCAQLLGSIHPPLELAPTHAPSAAEFDAASVELATAATELAHMSPPLPQRPARNAVASALEGAANAMAIHLRDRKLDRRATGANWRAVIAQVARLDRAASTSRLPECSVAIVAVQR
jgi:hypothetical protein